MKTTPELKESARSQMKEAFDRLHGQFRHHYSLSPPELKTKQAKTHAVIQTMLSVGDKLQWDKGVIRMLHDILLETFIANLSFLKPRTNKYEPFRAWLNFLKTNENPEQVVIKYLTKKVRGSDRVKAPAEAKDLLLKYYIDSRNLSSKRIAEEINKELKEIGINKTVSKSWVKKWWNECKSVGVLYREGIGAHRTKVVTQQRHKKPDYALSQVQIDGSSIQLIETFVDVDGKQISIFGNYFIVVDARSGKIVGFSTDISENSWMILKALEMATRNTGYLPAEILSDNSSAFHKKEFKTFLDRSAKLESCGAKMQYRKSRSRNPQNQSVAEAANQRLQFIAMQHDRFAVGQSPRTKHRRPDEYVKLLGSKAYRLTRDEVHSRFKTWVDLYNSTPFEGGHVFEGQSPDQIFESSEKKFAIPVSSFEVPVLFHRHTMIRVTQGLIKLQVRKEKLIYELNTPEEKEKYFGRVVNVYYDEDDLSEVIITDCESDSVLTICKKQRLHQLATAEQTDADRDVLRDRLKRNKEEAQFRMNRILEVINVPNEAHTKSEKKLAELHRLAQLQDDPIISRRKRINPELSPIELVPESDNSDTDKSNVPMKVIHRLSRWDD
jgi:transposase InsO family protein